jgi:uncharacterized SAM-binding protein YcdF (DUF218 family)
MEQFVTRTIEALILPPGLFLVLFSVGLLLLSKRSVLGKSLLSVGLIVFYLLSTPFIAGLLISRVETYPALDAKLPVNTAAGAIVVLASGRDKNAKEYGSDTVDAQTLLRSRYGAFLQRHTGLPILVSGGLVLDKEGKSLAQVMAELLREDFQAGEVWLEDKSRTTGENAFFSKKLLAVFEKAGLKIIPAPTAFEGGKPFKMLALLPSAQAINISRYALREMTVALWYKIRY